MNIATIINYCSNEYQFIEESVKSVAPFSRQVVVVMADHLFDGTKETDEDIQRSTTAVHSAEPCADLIVFEYDHNITLQQGTRYWHNMCRWVGVNELSQDIEYVLFLDADEIANSLAFIDWLDFEADTLDNVIPQTMKFANYFYFRDRKYQAITFEDSIVMAANRENLRNPDVMFAMERDSIYESGLTRSRNILGVDRKPMFHHYSWVRTKEQMLKKVQCWGHNKDKDWTELVEEEFSRPFNGTDFVHGYEYNILETK
jgi:hypothetical protein